VNKHLLFSYAKDYKKLIKNNGILGGIYYNRVVLKLQNLFKERAMQTVIDYEREKLHKVAQECGLTHERTLHQSKKIDELVYALMHIQRKKCDLA
jgi:hypothetical protein